MTAARRRRFNPDRDVEEWQGRYVRYDIVKEFVAAFLVVVLLVLLLSVLFSSPDEAPVTLQHWARAAPVDFATTAIAELDETSPTATYGPPYTSTPGVSQKLGPVSLPSIGGVTHPIDTAQDFVLGPLESLPPTPVLRLALAIYDRASPGTRAAWTAAYERGVAKASFSGNTLNLPAGRYGPVRVLIAGLLAMARNGAVWDGALTSPHQFYGTDYTKPLLFLADGTYLADIAQGQNLLGGQWGMMNETGNYPGQAWLWLYTFWYQISPFTTSTNADVQIWAIMIVLSAILLFVPFIPGLRSIPRWVPIYRIIWRNHYREQRTT